MVAKSELVACLVSTMINVTNVKIVLAEHLMIGIKEDVYLLVYLTLYQVFRNNHVMEDALHIEM